MKKGINQKLAIFAALVALVLSAASDASAQCFGGGRSAGGCVRSGAWSGCGWSGGWRRARVCGGTSTCAANYGTSRGGYRVSTGTVSTRSGGVCSGSVCSGGVCDVDATGSTLPSAPSPTCPGGVCPLPETTPETTPTPAPSPTCSGGTCSGFGAANVANPEGWTALEIEIVEIVNVERKRRGLRPLIMDGLRSAGARNVAARNAAVGRSEHYGLDFCGGEICAPGADARGALAMWLGSSGHYSLMMSSKYSRVSAGVAGGKSKFWTLRLW